MSAGTMLVYVLDADHGVKIGVTAQAIETRIGDLSRGAGFTPRLVRTFEVEARRARLIERAAHWSLRDCRTVGEWFHCHPLEACEAVATIIRSGIPLGMYQDDA